MGTLRVVRESAERGKEAVCFENLALRCLRTRYQALAGTRTRSECGRIDCEHVCDCDYEHEYEYEQLR